jgi:hypothetical protein
LLAKIKSNFSHSCDQLWIGKSASRPGDLVPER